MDAEYLLHRTVQYHTKETLLMATYLAIDIGASSGRHIIGRIRDGVIEEKEIYRFTNGAKEVNGHLIWDIEHLFDEIVNGLRTAGELGMAPDYIGIDTWGVDYALLDEHDERIGDIFCYRDGRTAPAIEALHGIMPFSELFARTGIQFQPFNTLYQLYADKQSGKLDAARSFLMLPCYLSFLLTGVKRQEYTNATTTGMINTETHTWDKEILTAAGLPAHLFGELTQPGSAVGPLTDEIAARVGYRATVLLPATHDTASAVLAAPLAAPAPYISSGTWSLLGIEQKTAHTDAQSLAVNYSNEGSLDFTFRYQQNIMGLWMLQSIRRELSEGLAEPISFGAIADMAKSCTCEDIVDVNHQDFLAPKSMIEAVRAHAPRAKTDAQVIRCVYDSLAACYAKSISDLEATVGEKFDTLHIIGGGSRDALLNELTAKTTGKRILTGPTEATALGNLLMQMIAAGELADLASARALIRNSVELGEF